VENRPYTIVIAEDDQIELIFNRKMQHGLSLIPYPPVALDRETARSMHTDLGEALGRFNVPELPAL
jgi:hypothetical protein